MCVHASVCAACVCVCVCTCAHASVCACAYSIYLRERERVCMCVCVYMCVKGYLLFHVQPTPKLPLVAVLFLFFKSPRLRTFWPRFGL